MKTFFRLLLITALAISLNGCKAFRTLTQERQPTSQGAPYELVVVCQQPQWEGALGDTLRTIFTEPVPYLNQKEPIFDMLRVTDRGFSGLVASHRNILRTVIDPQLKQASTNVQYNINSAPQILLTLQGPSEQSLTQYLSVHRTEMIYILEKAERDRAVQYAAQFNEQHIQQVILEHFGVEMSVPKGYVLATQGPDFIWARYEYPTASQGFFLYSRPYKGKESVMPDALLTARNQFAARVPGPRPNTYMITSEAFAPDCTLFQLDDRMWVEMRGFWDVQGDFMGGPFVSYSTVYHERVLTLDCYVFSPQLHKRNFMRGVEHLLHMIKFPAETPKAEAK